MMIDNHGNLSELKFHPLTRDRWSDLSSSLASVVLVVAAGVCGGD